MKKMKILVIGASGLLAAPVIRRLDEAGFELRLFSRSVKPSMFDKDFDLVQGDVFNPADLEKAMEGCDAIHISLSTPDDAASTEAILATARKFDIRRISIISGCTVREENRDFAFIDQKFRAEQAILSSGIPCFIFRPTWFFESLSLMVRNGKATIIGRQEGVFHWVAADDLARMVARAYSQEDTEQGIYYVYGPEGYTMEEILTKYCRELHPEIEQVKHAPIPMLRFIAWLTRKPVLKFAVNLFAYFEKAREPQVSEQELAVLGRPETTFDTWIESQRPVQ